MRRHVLVIPSSYPRPGSAVSGLFYRDQARALLSRGLTVGVVYPDVRSVLSRGRSDLLTNLFRVRRSLDGGETLYRSTFPAIPRASKATSRLWLHQLRRLVRRYVAEQGSPDIIHAHGLVLAGVGAAEAANTLSVPLVLTAHSSAFARDLVADWQKAAVAEALRRADAILAVSGALARDIAVLAPSAETQVVPNLVDTDYFDLPRPDRATSGPFTFLVVALLHPQKGVDVAIRAFAQAFPGESDAVLRIVGDGPEASRLRALSRKLGTDGRVVFTGLQPREAVRAEMHKADALILPSRTETFGVVLVEALATGLPVVATRSGGPQDIVGSEVGYLVEVDDPAGMADAVVELRRNREMWHDRGAAIREHARRRFGQQAVTDRIIEVYQGAAGWNP